MDIIAEAQEKYEFLLELNAESEHQIDASNSDELDSFLLGWPEYNYGGAYVEHTKAVIAEIMRLDAEQSK